MAITLKDISTDPTIAPPRIICYGPHKIGKTTFGASAPSPILLPTEEGIGRLSVTHFPLMRSYSEVIEAIGSLYSEDHQFKTLVIDSVDWLEPLIWAQTCQKHGWADIESPGYGKGFLLTLDEWRGILDGINALRSKRNMAIILLAHAQIRRFDAPDSEPYDRYQIKLQDRASALLEEWSDVILFANFKTYVTKEDVGFNKKVARGLSSGERIMYTEERPAFRAGNRYSLPPQMPFSWDAFQTALTKSVNEGHEEPKDIKQATA